MAKFWRILNGIFTVDFLSDHLSSRKNNYTVIRLLFAIVVMFGHGYALTNYKHHRVIDPVSKALMLPKSWVGDSVVCGFFFISGILIVQSYRNRENINAFLMARVLRIYPGVIVCVLLTSFVIGPFLTKTSVGTYFTSEQLYCHCIRNCFLYKVDFSLPSLFQNLPNQAPNGSLWTLPLELRCYGYVALFGLLGLLRKAWRTNLALAFMVLVGVWRLDLVPLVGEVSMFGRPALFFAAGAFCCVNARFIPLTAWLMVPLLVIYVISFHTSSLRPLAPVVLTYGILFAAYRLPFIDMDRFGDFSYGVYIYAFPVQQALNELIQKIGPRTSFAIAFPITFGLAVLSWYYVEKPALKMLRGLRDRPALPVVPVNGVSSTPSAAPEPAAM